MSSPEFDPFSLAYTAEPQRLFAELQRERPLYPHAGLGSWFAHPR
jgi:hypothetical protein